MKVLAPYVNFDPNAAIALGRYVPREAELVLAYTGEDDFSYWKVFMEHWTGEQDLMFVEQDVEIHGGVYQTLKQCVHNWCTFWYAGAPTTEAQASRLVDCMGCTRFSANLQKATRQRFEDKGPLKWDMLDRELGKILRSSGFHCITHGQVRHHHRYEITFIPSVSNITRMYTWRHLDKNEYPNDPYHPPAPEDAERIIIDCSRLDHEAE